MLGKADGMQSLNDAPNDAQTMPALMEADLPRAPGPSHLPCKGMPGSPTVRLASQAPYTACAYCDSRTPCEKKKGDGAEPGFEPGTLRLLAVCSNH